VNTLPDKAVPLTARIFYHACGIPLSHRALVGAYGESYALRKLRTNGFFLWEQNWKIKQGELDLIGRIKDVLVIVEVKTRIVADSSLATIITTAQDNYTLEKHRRVTTLAEKYINATRVRQSRERVRFYRIDLVALDLKLKWGFLPKLVSYTHVEGI